MLDLTWSSSSRTDEILLCYEVSLSRFYLYIMLHLALFLLVIGLIVFKIFPSILLILQVTTPLLKFMSEFVLNKAQRLTFDSSSPNGILLFREVSKLIVAYGSRILALPNAADIYAFKYKGIWISLTILTRGENMNLLFSEKFGESWHFFSSTKNPSIM